MSPIKDLSDSVRLPRLGKIHLGTRDPERGFPRKTDHFVLPKDHSDYAKLVECFGEKPKELRILIPVEDDEQWATQYYKSYNQTYGLVCKGDGEMALRMVDTKTRELPVKDQTGPVELREMPCEGKDCPIYKNKGKGKPQCHEVMNLKFLLPEVPGLGVWQIDTGSKNSILNINSCARIIKRAFGRISLVPLKLTFEPVQVNNPEDGKKQTVYVLNLRTDVTLAQLADLAREQAKMFMIEAPDLEAAFDVEVEKDIDDLFGEKKDPEATTSTPDGINQDIEDKSGVIPQGEGKSPADELGEHKPKGDRATISNIDMNWVRESLKIIKWSEKTATGWVSAFITKKEENGTLLEVLSGLTREQLKVFGDKLTKLREVA